MGGLGAIWSEPVSREFPSRPGTCNTIDWPAFSWRPDRATREEASYLITLRSKFFGVLSNFLGHLEPTFDPNSKPFKKSVQKLLSFASKKTSGFAIVSFQGTKISRRQMASSVPSITGQ